MQQLPRFRRLALTLALLLGAQFIGASFALADGSPVWKVKGQHNTVFFLGSIHMLAPTETLPSSVDRAYAEAEKLVMEIDMDDLDPLAAQPIMMAKGLLPEDQSLSDILGPKATEQFDTQVRAIGIDPALLSRFRPWLAAITLSQLQLMQKGMDPQSGVEMRLVERAKRDAKEITGLETLEEQLGLMANLPDRQQKQFLLYTLEETAAADREIDSMLAAWRSGDTDTLAKVLEKGFQEFPDLYGPLTVDRNRRWMSRIETLLHDDEDYLVVVGVLHMVGKDGLIDLLQRRGYTVTQQ